MTFFLCGACDYHMPLLQPLTYYIFPSPTFLECIQDLFAKSIKKEKEKKKKLPTSCTTFIYFILFFVSSTAVLFALLTFFYVSVARFMSLSFSFVEEGDRRSTTSGPHSEGDEKREIMYSVSYSIY